MRELALAKLQDAGKSNVELWVDDLVSWQPDQDYDVVFFAFWLVASLWRCKFAVAEVPDWV